MEENIKEKDKVKKDDNASVGLGICFGSGMGIVLGAILGNVALWLSVGAAVGVVLGSSYDLIKKKKQ